MQSTKVCHLGKPPAVSSYLATIILSEAVISGRTTGSEVHVSGDESSITLNRTVSFQTASFSTHEIMDLVNHGYVIEFLPSSAVLELPLNETVRTQVEQYSDHGRGDMLANQTSNTTIVDCGT